MRGVHQFKTVNIAPDGQFASMRSVPIEVPVAIEFNGIGYSVMMASPSDLEDFAIGFALSEGIARELDDITEVESHQTESGWLLKIRLVNELMPHFSRRIRNRVSESSCGICGMTNLQEVRRSLPELDKRDPVSPTALFRATNDLFEHQPMNRLTGGVHAAAFCELDGKIVVVREDVGRHNALDKLIGSLAAEKIPPNTGFFLVSSRCSFELVEKTILAGCPTLVAISTATSIAVERAKESGLELIGLARQDSMINFNPKSL